MMRVRQEAKHDKLVQYAAEVWGLKDGPEDARIAAAILKTEAFFRELGLPVRLGDARLGIDAAEKVAANLAAHGLVKLGEDEGVTP